MNIVKLYTRYQNYLLNRESPELSKKFNVFVVVLEPVRFSIKGPSNHLKASEIWTAGLPNFWFLI